MREKIICLSEGENAVSTVREEFFKTHGPLITTAQLAKILSRTEEGLRVGMYSKTEFSRQLREAKKHFGRRVHIDVKVVHIEPIHSELIWVGVM